LAEPGTRDWIGLKDAARVQRIMKALGSSTRLEIIELIQRGISNPGQIARKMNRHRSTIEKHLAVLATAGVIEKSPSLNELNRLEMRYKVRDSCKPFLAVIESL
jgi:DNA-binding transcriptional ArsR family regulator